MSHSVHTLVGESVHENVQPTEEYPRYHAPGGPTVCWAVVGARWFEECTQGLVFTT